MDRYLPFWALLAVCVALVSAKHGLVKTKDTVRTKDGRLAQITKTADADCRLEQVTTEEEDGSVSAILKDYVTGKSVLLKSTVQDVCYVIDIPQDEMQEQEEHCLDGEKQVKPGSVADKAERVYAEGGPAAPGDLSEELAEVCKDRRLVTLQDVTDRAQNASSTAQKRECHAYSGTVHCTAVEVNCRNVCVRHGWWWSSSTCKRTERRCDTGTRCYDGHGSICYSE